MRKLPLFAIVMVIAFSANSSAFAQAKTDSSFNIRFGIGVGISNWNLFTIEGVWSNIMPFDLVFPVDVSQNFRLEPTFGIVLNSRNRETGSDRKLSLTKYGLGLIYMNRINNNLQMNLGIRPSIAFYKEDVEGSLPYSYAQSQTIIGVSATFGGEYYFAPQFSFGVEAQINYMNFGAIKTEPNVGNNGDISSSLASSAHLFARIYFSR